MNKFQMITAIGALVSSPALAANTGTLLGTDIPSITSAGGSNNDDVGLTIAYLNSLPGVAGVVYLGTFDGPGNDAPLPVAGETITGVLGSGGLSGTFTASPYAIFAYDVKAGSHNALYEVPGGAFTVNADTSAILVGKGEHPAFSHLDFFGCVSTCTPRRPVPEPTTWAMMLLGFGGLGAAMRQRRKRTLAQIA